MFLRGMYDGRRVDNTTEAEVSTWLELIREVAPQQVMIYTIDRETPAHGLEKIPLGELMRIGRGSRHWAFPVRFRERRTIPRHPTANRIRKSNRTAERHCTAHPSRSPNKPEVPRESTGGGRSNDLRPRGPPAGGTGTRQTGPRGNARTETAGRHMPRPATGGAGKSRAGKDARDAYCEK